MQHIQHKQQGCLPKASRGLATFLHSTQLKPRVAISCSATRHNTDVVNAAKLRGILPLVALAACTQLALPISGDVAQAAPTTESSLQTTGYVRIERRKLENLLVKQFKASLSELSDEELAVLFEDVILSKRITAVDMLQPGGRTNEFSTSNYSTPITDASPPRTMPSDRNQTANQSETEVKTAAQQAAPPTQSPNSWAASLGFRADNPQAPDVGDKASLQPDKTASPAVPKDTFTVPWSRQPPIESPDTASPPLTKGTTGVEAISAVNGQQKSNSDSLDTKTQENEMLQIENEEGADPTLQLLQQLMGQTAQNEKNQVISSSVPNPAADKVAGSSSENESWLSNTPLSSVFERFPSAPQLPSLPRLPNVGDALNSVGAASQQVLAGAAAVSEGLELNGRAQAALGLGGIAITVATVALLMEAKQQPDDSTVPNDALSSQSQPTASSTDDKSNQKAASQNATESVTGVSADDTSSRADSTSGSDTEQKSRDNSPPKRSTSPTSRRGAYDMQKLLDNGPVLSPPPPPVVPSSVMNDRLPSDLTYNTQTSSTNSANGSSTGGILWQRQATNNNQPSFQRPASDVSSQWDNGRTVQGSASENTSSKAGRVQAGRNSNSNVDSAVSTYQVPSDPWNPETDAAQLDANGTTSRPQQQTMQANNSWAPQEPRTIGVNVEERQSARPASQLPSPWDS